MLTLKEQIRLKEYEKEIAEPYWKYILTRGLAFGFLFFIISTIEEYIFDKQSFHWDLKLLLNFFISILVGGFIYGWLMRKFITWYHKKLKAKDI